MYKLNDQIDIQEWNEMPPIAFVLCGTNFGLVDNDTFHCIYFIKQDGETNKVYLVGFTQRHHNANAEYFKIVYDPENKTTVKKIYRYYDIFSNFRAKEFDKVFKFDLNRGDKVYICEEIFKTEDGFAYALVRNNLDYFKPSNIIVSLRKPEEIQAIEDLIEDDDEC